MASRSGLLDLCDGEDVDLSSSTVNKARRGASEAIAAKHIDRESHQILGRMGGNSKAKKKEKAGLRLSQGNSINDAVSREASIR